MFAPVIISVHKIYAFRATGPILFIGLCANCMGTALLLGDLPPQMLHSVSGIEFVGFICHSGRPSSFFILTAAYLIVCFLYYLWFRKSELSRCTPNETALLDAVAHQEHRIKDTRFAFVVCTAFVLTIFGMSLRQFFGVKLGFIAFVGSLLLVFSIEILRKFHKIDAPDVEHILAEFEWSAIAFYAALFALVGALEQSGVLTIVGNWFIPFVSRGLLVGTSVIFWATAPIVGFVEHDAYILTLLYVIRDLGQTQGVNVWPYYWSLLWAGTLGSNLTVAGAPTLYVAPETIRKWIFLSLLRFL